MWRKSSFSGQAGTCVEVDVFKSSSFTHASCVQVGQFGDVVRVRDSKDPDGPVQSYRFDEWQAFIDGVKDGQFDLPTRHDPSGASQPADVVDHPSRHVGGAETLTQAV